MEREKACGGGVTERAWRSLPLLGELDVPHLEVRRSLYSPPSMRAAEVPGHDPIRVYSRKEMDLALLEAAASAGARWIPRRVRSIVREGDRWRIEGEDYDFLVGADGAGGITRRTLGGAFAKGDRLLCVGYFLPGDFPPEVRVEFFPGFFGYAWLFPRLGHASAGIGAMGGVAGKEELYHLLHLFLARRYPGADLTTAVRYGGFAPCIKEDDFGRYPHAGEGWAMVGDAAGFCDPMTGEGLFYAFESARVLAEALADAEGANAAVERYLSGVKRTFLPELRKSSHFLFRFYQDRYLEKAMFTIRHSASAKRLAANFIAGRQSLITIRRDVLKMTPRVLLEMITGRWG